MSRAERTFPVRVGSVAAARQFTRSVLSDWELSTGEDAALIVTELAANVVRYAGGDEFAVALCLDPPSVLVEVRDTNPEEPHVSQPGPASTSGRGLLIVERLASRWGCRREGDGGKTVWAEITVE